MKRILALSLSAALLLTLLCACTGADPETTVNSSVPAGESATVSPTDNTQEPSLAPPSEEPWLEPSEEPSVKPGQVDLAAFYLGLTEKYAVCETPEQAYPDDLVNDDSWFEPGTDMEQRQEWLEEQREQLREMALGIYPDLAGIATEQYLVYAPMFSLSAAESVLIQVSNAADVDAVKDILQARIDIQVSGGAFYPFAVETWQNNSRIVSNGSYIMMIVSPDCDAVVSEFNALFS